MRRLTRLCGIAAASGIAPALALALPASGAAGQAASPAPAAPATRPATDGLPAPRTFVTHHRTVIGGTPIAFTATAGESYLYDDAGAPAATVFSYAYTRDGAGTDRPVLFIVPGGPGGATGSGTTAFGPWRVLVRKDGNGVAHSVPPYDVEDNPASLLDVADLVFIDPVGTGYSRILGVGKPEQFYSVDGDIDAMGQFIQQWLVRNRRWNSPRYLAGESYGGMRAAMFPRGLNGNVAAGVTRGVVFNGVIPIANTLALPGWGSEGLEPALVAASMLPSYAVAAWFHQRIDRRGRTLEAYHDEAYAFAIGDYAAALRKDAAKTLSPAERAATVLRLVQFTGLPPATFDKTLSLDAIAYTGLALGDRGLRIGAYDSRMTSPAALSGTDPVGDDPSLARWFPIEIGGYRAIERAKLGITMDRPYNSQDFRNVALKWGQTRWPSPTGGKPFRTQAEELGSAMAVNDDLRALILVGYFDLVMPTGQARMAIDQAHLPRDRTTLRFYEAGHSSMADAITASMANDIRAFIRRR